MDLKTFFWAGLTSLLPIAELRGGLPIALAGGMHPLLAYLYCVAANMLVTPLVYLFLETVHKLLLRFGWYKKFSEKLIERARKKVAAKMEKYGWIGLAVFVAIPLLFTGAYTGALGAWVLGMSLKRTFLTVSLGVAVAGGLVLGAYYLAGLGLDAFKIFFKSA